MLELTFRSKKMIRFSFFFVSRCTLVLYYSCESVARFILFFIILFIIIKSLIIFVSFFIFTLNTKYQSLYFGVHTPYLFISHFGTYEN